MKPALIKIDVIGHELSVLAGGSNVLKNDRPLIVFECKHKALEMIPLLNKFDYKSYIIVKEIYLAYPKELIAVKA